MNGRRIGVAGAGIVGTLLAWRLRLADRNVRVELVDTVSSERGATGASGGLVRGYDPEPRQLYLAASSLAELRASRLLRAWSCYQETGSVYLQADSGHPAALAELERLLPGSVQTRGPGEAPYLATRHAVVERHAGFISPRRLRDEVLADFVRMGGDLVHGQVGGIRAEPDGTVSWQVDGQQRRYDTGVLATGPWTPALLPGDGYRTKLIQYGVYEASGTVPAPFVDEVTGLYGRPGPGNGVLLGVPSDTYDIDPAKLRPDPALVRRTTELATRVFPGLGIAGLRHIVVAADCYTAPQGLRLRPAAEAVPHLFTFTGGSGGAAKTAIAAARQSADSLLHHLAVPA
ncbi:NAD(P)/FAD-dependent oxidoreductase [Streptomyces sporangiiformans]|uniref:FAD-binding oxidoreductase n=1 Tax=Streptomyces sporangiiformans TaxID=2315329 RepID=A0A505DKL9_9ACTN|nr:FAD-dependent oxidoreductase [Streptomyces sporangiiformans]TPQ18611.1 FAD-binding oxidoreductase [Streptomyces sporangiiformans]